MSRPGNESSLDNCSLLCDGGPKYDRIPTPYPATRTRPGCSGRPRATLRISLRPHGLKVPCVDCSLRES
ncbi:hypothetical protein PHAVU_009G179800 [Phaseolus vulgaris]|uniref:Uncharacterized protein n=1 Tax=Phaseolus vulgaris TaxID=3885 RepID=V7AWQ5_PHAVU|nr:hypothetical protein PHAVU_009G179800g [Phaseolus vulgaris]ESW10087.1 hypothetical protein PHAVU_009G179800g [Phaseolus vulgaris]